MPSPFAAAGHRLVHPLPCQGRGRRSFRRSLAVRKGEERGEGEGEREG